MEDRNKIDNQTESIDRQNRDQETERKPTQGSQDMNRQQQGQTGNAQQGQTGNIQEGQQGQNKNTKDKEKKSA